MTSGGRRVPLCPSAQPAEDALVIGVAGGTVAEPRVRPLEHPVPVSLELLALAGPVQPTEVFRFAAPCQEGGCAHFARSTCTLASKVVRMLPPVTTGLPPCDIRASCRWFAQEGREACLRCPQVLTHNAEFSPELRQAADPTVPVPD
jgi:hypothetical protein